MVYGFARQSGGTARIYSEIDRGTTVSLYLPLIADVVWPELPAPANVVIRTRGVALAVDDEPDLLDIAATYLKDLGFTVLEASDGPSALALLQERSDICLMITDVVMAGGMNGVELASKARLINPDIKIIYSSGFPARTLGERTEPSIDGPLLRKPFQRQDFVTSIAQVMSSKESTSDDVI